MESYAASGLTFDVTDRGPNDGEVVILLHGYPETRASWEPIIPALVDAGYRVLAPDQRGYSPGARPPGRRAYGLELLTADVVALIDACGRDRVHIVGHDWGGGVAWSLAHFHPDRVASVTSLATPHPRAFVKSLTSSDQALRSWYMLFFQLPWIPEAGMRGFGERSLRRTLSRSGLDQAGVDECVSFLQQPGAATAALNWYRAVPFSPPTRIGAIVVPTMYVYASGDFALGRRAADLTEQYMRAPYRYEVLEGVSHWLHREVPDTVATLILDHLAKHAA
jgi:pimeloyl-ACP methyl ester carboxylesterase